MSELSSSTVIVKVGSNILTHSEGPERLDYDVMQRIGGQVLDLQRQDTDVILVSSAAITAGMAMTNDFVERPDDITELQRLASLGWPTVVQAWTAALSGAYVGEVLLTKHELGMRKEREEALKVIHKLLSYGDIPLINENDTISHNEITFGDNDLLAATLAAQISDSRLFRSKVKLILLSDVDGVYQNPEDTDSVIPEIESLDRYDSLIHAPKSTVGRGGMHSKFRAAHIAAAAGIDMWIANGNEHKAIERAISGEIGTHFSLH